MKEVKIRLKGECGTRIVWLNGVELFPQASQKVKNHSPDGFNWGYGGSGPAQLALAVLLKIADKETALANYQQFKFDVIAGLKDNFDITIDVSKYVGTGKCLHCSNGECNTCAGEGR
jgi:hypothetical protein